jgi:hypothetical protein
LDRSAQHFLMPEADSGVVALANGTKVIGEGFDRWVVFVINVLRVTLTEGTLFASGVASPLLLGLKHNEN